MPASSDRLAMSRGLALLFFAGATLVVVTLALPHGHHEAPPILLVPAGLAYVVVAVLLAAPGRLDANVLSAILAIGTVLVGLCVVFSDRAGSAYAFMYVWVALFAAAFFGTRTLVAHLAWLGVVYGAALAVSGHVHPPAAHWLLAVGTSSVAAVFIHQLSGELRGRANDLAQVTRLANEIGGVSEISREAIAAAVCEGVLGSTRAAAATLYEISFDDGIEQVGRRGTLAGAEPFERAEGAATLREAQASGRCERLVAGDGKVIGLVEPVLHEGRVLGLLALGWERPRRLNSRAIAAVPLFAAEAGVALHRIADQSRDRERRALEINDAIVQGLVVARYALSEGRLEVGEKAIGDTLARARALVEDQLQALHGAAAPEPGTLRREGRGIG